MRILIIGGTRFIGAAVARQLHIAGHNVAVFHTGKTPGNLPVGITRIHGDTRKLAASHDDLLAFRPDVVLHNIVLCEEDVTATQELFSGVARRLVMTSSMDVYLAYGRLLGTEPGPPVPHPVDEDGALRTEFFPYRKNHPDPGDPMHNYDKIPAEKAVLAHSDLPGTVLRLPMVIGEHDGQRRLLPLAKPMHDQRKALVWSAEYADWISTWGYVENVAAAMVLATTDDRAIGCTFNVADKACSMRELAVLVADATGWTGEIVTARGEQLPETLRFDVANPHPLACDATRIQRELGFSPPVSFADGVRRTVEWELANIPDPLPPGVADYAAQDEALARLRSDGS